MQFGNNHAKNDYVKRRENVGEALSRAAGSPLIEGNHIRLLKDAEENYPAWIDAIRGAKQWIHLETYIIHQDEIGYQFADLLASKVREGVRVRLIYDWIGSLGNASWLFWRRMAKSGMDVRCFNPPSLDSPFGWITRDHRKLISVDGEVAYISGLCIGKRWIGYPERGIEPWRDTGVEIKGPALAEIDRAFTEAWAATGEPLPEDETAPESKAEAGDTAVRIVASVPNSAGMYRLDQLMAALAQRTVWLSDAYFIGTTSYVQALRSAAKSGVDVRLLVPGANDVPIMRSLSRAGFRPLLEAGVRVFEWNGPMMHAKTAVVDGQWARVGSTNLNRTSWLSNWELDAIVEDERFARQMEKMYLDDLSRATEIVLSTRRRPLPIVKQRRRRRRPSGARQATTGMIRLGNVVGAAITNRRELGPAEAVIMSLGAAILMAVAVVAIYWPKIIAVPIAVVCAWMAISLFIRSYKLRSQARSLRASRSRRQESRRRVS